MAPSAGSRSGGSGRTSLLLIVVSLGIGGVLCAKDVPLERVVALVGKPSFLPCNISPSQKDDSPHLILWLREDRDGSPTSIYSVDARDRDFSLAQHWSDEKVFWNRAHFELHKQPAQLGIDNVREDDAGMYRCRVEFRFGQTRNSNVNLTVIVPPENITILNENGDVLRSSAGPYYEGDDLRLFCDVHGGKPPPMVSWYRNGEFAGNASHSQRDGLTRSELRLKNLGRRDVDTRITCNATNNDRSSPLSVNVTLVMYFQPLEVSIKGNNQPLSAGKRVDVVCDSSGSRPPAVITWYKDDQELWNSTNVTMNSGNTTSSVLSFVASKSDAGRNLTCRAKNPTMKASPMIEDSWTLRVQYTPETRIQLGANLNPDDIKEGSDVYFDCIIEAEPSVYKVEWRHQGRTLSHNVSQGVVISNQSLAVRGLTRKNAGNYVCVGFNVEGDGISQPFYLNVMFAPTCSPNQTKIHGVAKQENATIPCEVDANPPEVIFHWTFNNSAMSTELTPRHFTSTTTRSTATYTPTIELDYGTLLCWAENKIGQQQAPCVYHIIPAGHPDAVHNCTITNTSKSAFALQCSPGFDGGMSQSFQLEVRESGSHRLAANLTSSLARFSVGNLEAGSLYQALVYAYNAKGRSEPVLLQASTLSPPEKQLTSDSEKPHPTSNPTAMMSVIIGVVVALVIVMAIVVVIVRTYQSPVDEQAKSSHAEDNNCNSRKHCAAKPPTIQRELRFRECGSLITDEIKLPDSFGKLDAISTGGDASESDEKNPDIIPQQQITGEEVSEYLRKRRLVSTIETSPSRVGLLERSALAVGPRPNYAGYCTIRSSMPLRELSNTVKFKPKPQHQFQPMASEVCESGMCTLPRQHWPSHHHHHHHPHQQQHVSSTAVALSLAGPPSVLYTTGSGAISVVRTTPSGCPVLLAKEVVEARLAQQQPQLSTTPPPPIPPMGQCCVQGSPKEAPPPTLKPPLVPPGILVTKRESSV